MNAIEKNRKLEIIQLHGEVCGNIKTMFDKGMRIGELLTEQKAELKHGEWLPWLKENVPFAERTARDYMRMYARRAELKTAKIADLTTARKLLTVPNEKKDSEPLAVDEGGHIVNFDKPFQQDAPYRPTFNHTNANIDWARWSWNPVTGCNHGCKYCYARDIANRFYKQGFKPTFHPERLLAPENTRIPQRNDIREYSVFVCSMADLFGDWVPQQWIDDVLDKVIRTPAWNYLFLTKNPDRMVDIDWPDNAWIGATVDVQARVGLTEQSFRKIDAAVKFLSCEPLEEDITFSDISVFDWVIVGGRSRTSQAPAAQPQWEWVDHLYSQARAAGIPIYFKPNLTVRPQEVPTPRVQYKLGLEVEEEKAIPLF